MPYKKIKLKSGKYKVINSKTGKVHAYGTTSEKADAQIRLMHMKDDEDVGWDTEKHKVNRHLKKRGF